MSEQLTCGTCAGTGLVHPQQNSDVVCEVCGGSGKVGSPELAQPEAPAEEPAQQEPAPDQSAAV